MERNLKKFAPWLVTAALVSMPAGAAYLRSFDFLVSRTASTPSSGQVRMAHTDTVTWENQAGNGSTALKPNASTDVLSFNGVDLVDLTTAQTVSGKTLTAVAPLTVASGSGVAKIRVASPTASANKYLEFVPTTSPSPTSKSWLVGSDNSALNTFEVTPSVTSGGTDYTNPALTITTAGVVNVPNLTASLPVQTDASKNLTSAAINLSGTQATGTLAAARMPALTGDVTTSAGAVATTVAKIAGTTVSGTTGTTNSVFSASPTLTGTVTTGNITAGGDIRINAGGGIASVAIVKVNQSNTIPVASPSPSTNTEVMGSGNNGFFFCTDQNTAKPVMFVQSGATGSTISLISDPQNFWSITSQGGRVNISAASGTITFTNTTGSALAIGCLEIQMNL